MKREVFAVLAVLGVVSTTQAMAKETITVWGWSKEMKVICDDFMKKFPDIKVKYLLNDWRSVNDKLLMTMVSGTAVPDVTMCDVQYIPRYVNQGGLFASLDPFGAPRYRDKVVENRWKTASIKGKLYAMPLDVGPIATWYRPVVLAQAGFPSDPASVGRLLKDWNSFYEVAKKITKETDGKGLNGTYALSNGRMIQRWSQQQLGARLFDEDLRVMVDKEDLPKWTESIRLGKNYRDNGMESKLGWRWDGTWTKAMKSNRLAFAMEAVWYGPEMKTMGGQVNVCPLPTGIGANEGGSYLAIPAAAKRKKEAWKFIEYVCLKDSTQEKLLRLANWFPTFKPAYDAPAFKESSDWTNGQAYLKVFAEAAMNTPYIPATRHDQAANDIVSAELTKVWAGKDIATALRDTATNMRRSLRGAR